MFGHEHSLSTHCKEGGQLPTHWASQAAQAKGTNFQGEACWLLSPGCSFIVASAYDLASE